jgi:hypothetical protein
MSVVFISYSRKDAEIADEIRDMLVKYEIAAITPWQDTKDIRGGERWHLEIDRAIQDSFAMLVICTENSKISPNVTYEWALALGINNIAVMPIYFDKVDERVPVQLKTHEGFNYNDGAFWSRLVSRLQELQINDSQLNLRIPWTASPYIRNLAVRAFYSSYIDDSLDAIETLGGMVKDPNVREILINGLNHPQTKIVDKILQVMDINDFYDVRAIPKLKELMEEKPALLNTISRILSSMGEATVHELAREIRTKTPDIRYKLINIISATQHPSLIPYYVDLLNDTDEELQLETLRHINSQVQQGWHRSSNNDQFKSDFQIHLLPVLVQLLDRSDSLRMMAENCLQAIGTNEAIRALMEWRKIRNRT